MVHAGKRSETLAALVGIWTGRGHTRKEVQRFAVEFGKKCCLPPLPQSSVQYVVKTVLEDPEVSAQLWNLRRYYRRLHAAGMGDSEAREAVTLAADTLFKLGVDDAFFEEALREERS
jgi:7-keto-8-aminopelargonate synthetase-like enzyme